jgi:hypothetical protein
LKFELNSPIHDRDPNVAKRIRHLRVNPMWFKPPESVSFAGGRVRRWYSKFRFFGGSASKFRILDAERPVIQAMTIDLVGSFRNVTRYTIVTRYHPNPANLPPFLAIAWKSFGSNLRRLTLNAPLGGFETLIATSGHLDALEDLNLRFSTDVATEDTAEDMATMLRFVVPFINSLSSTLRSLTILSSAFQDHTPFFHSLGHFPKLLSFALYIAFNPPLISDPSGLTRFLNDHAETLQHVTLQPHISFRSFPSESAKQHFSTWMISSSSNEMLFTNLRSLTICPATPLFSWTDFDVTSIYVRRSPDTLTSLILGDRYLNYDDVDRLVRTFTHRPMNAGLKTLHLRTLSLNPQLFDLLSRKLPGLEEFNLTFCSLVGDVKQEGVNDDDSIEMVSPGNLIRSYHSISDFCHCV